MSTNTMQDLHKQASLRQAVASLKATQDLLKAAGEPMLAMKVGALASQIKAAKNEAIRDAEFGLDL